MPDEKKGDLTIEEKLKCEKCMCRIRIESAWQGACLAMDRAADALAAIKMIVDRIERIEKGLK